MTTLFTNLHWDGALPPRLETGFSELDRVLGGGFVRGSAILVSGDPGAGKSTLMLQVAAAIARRRVFSGPDSYGYGPVAYITAEEAETQVQLRALRLGISKSPVMLAAVTDLEPVLLELEKIRPALVVADSLQTLEFRSPSDGLRSPKTIVGVLRGLVAFTRSTSSTMVAIGHVTKDNRTAGPMQLQHEVDVCLGIKVLGKVRAIQASKNRFGATDEVGLFEMRAEGMREMPLRNICP